MRIDRWLWAARFHRTRSLAQAAVEAGHVTVGGERVKVARLLRVGDVVCIRAPGVERTVVVRALDEVRRAAPLAQRLWEETPESVADRVRRLADRALMPEPAEAVRGRPTKRDRRRLDAWQP